jgi:hypothetical protein
LFYSIAQVILHHLHSQYAQVLDEISHQAFMDHIHLLRLQKYWPC